MQSKKETGLFSSVLGGKKRKESLEERIKYYDISSNMPNGYQLDLDFRALETKSGQCFVLMQMNGLQQMASLFSYKVAGETYFRLCPLMRDFAEEHGGRVYRLSLDRFAMLFPGADPGELDQKVLRLCQRLELVNVKDQYIEYSCHYTFSYAVYPMTKAEDHLDGIDPVLQLADAVASREKDSYQSAGVILDAQVKPKWELLIKLADYVQGAWEARQFVPHYQLVYDIEKKTPVGAELLTRWQHPELGLLLPKDFLPVMESKGLIMDLDLYMVEEACKKIRGWMDNELVTVPLSVNISKLNVHRSSFVDRLTAIVERYEVPPVLIELELSESMMIFEKNMEFLETLKRFHEYGFRVTVDNFASSDFSSMNLLRDLELDVLKISPRFFRNVDLLKANRDRTFVKSMIDMAKSLEIKLVALGVETKEQALLAKILGCECGQGYYFSKPVSNEEFEKQIF